MGPVAQTLKASPVVKAQANEGIKMNSGDIVWDYESLCVLMLS